MKYWKFDCVQLLSDYKKNCRILVAVQTQLQNAESHVKHPEIEPEQYNEWCKIADALRVRCAEYQGYVDLVVLGLNELDEISRLTLKYWLVDKMGDRFIIEKLSIKNQGQLDQIKKIALNRFYHQIVEN